MAQFQKGSPQSLERNLGIMYGYLGAEDFDSARVFTLNWGQDLIAEMVMDQVIPDEEGEKIYKSMEDAGLCPDMEAIADKIKSFTLPKDFISAWQVESDYCENCQTKHAKLVNRSRGLEIDQDSGEFFDALDICNDLFQKNEMELGEAAWVLKEILEKFPLETKTEEQVSIAN